MARTKQTARKSTGGRAPRRQLATKAARSFRQYMTSQQNLGNAVINNNSSNKQTNKTSFINYENTLSSFSFRPDKGSHGETAEFSPRFSVASTKDKQTGSTEDWLGITFESKYDGQGIKQHPREPIGICICLDISGSMGWSFSEDTPGTFGNFARGGKSKLEVAKTCIKAILEQLSPDDLFSVVLFNHDHQTFLPLQSVGSLNRGKFQRDLAKLKPSGGTCLGEGFEAGARIFDFGVQTRKKKSGGPSRASQLKNKRVVFLTDMESHIADEESVLETARLCADDGTCFTTIVGIGVDLSVGTVQALSSIAGAKYSSCINSKEFEKTIGEEFLHDVTPIAFHINIKSLTSGAVFSKGYGSPELNALKDQQDIKLSSEFPSVYAADGQVLGGMMLVKLNLDGLATGNTSRGLGNKAVGKGKKKAKDERRFVLQVKWTAPSGEQRVEIANVTMPPAFPEEEAKEQANNDADGDEMMVPQQQEEEEDGRYSNTNIRKAIALVRYVDLQSEYVLDDTLQAEGGDRAAAGGGGSGLPLDAQRAVHQSYIQRFATFEPWLRRELRACGDTSVEAGGANANVTDTLRQIVELEQRELAGLETRAGAAAAGGEGREAENERLAAQAGLPAEFLCPIGRGLMGDPVVAGDGHSYDRAAIAAWIAARGGGGGAGVPSPMTLRALPSLALTPNIALRKMIADYRAAHPPPGAVAATAAAAAGPLGPGLAAGGGGAAAGRKKGAAAGRRNKGAAAAGNEKEVPKLAAAKNNSTKKKQLAVDRNGKVGGKYNLRRRNMK